MRRYQLARIQLPDFKDTCHSENVRARHITLHPVAPSALLSRADLGPSALRRRARQRLEFGGRQLVVEQATCDYPQIFYEKLVWSGLTEYAPPVAQLMQRFFMESKLQLAIEAAMKQRTLGIVSAVCEWLQSEENVPTWSAWLPPHRYWVQCEVVYKTIVRAGELPTCDHAPTRRNPTAHPARHANRAFLLTEVAAGATTLPPRRYAQVASLQLIPSMFSSNGIQMPYHLTLRLRRASLCIALFQATGPAAVSSQWRSYSQMPRRPKTTPGAPSLLRHSTNCV
jgi:hypothetical protein